MFPGETLNLHIFEPRYRQLIQECFAEQKPFGIPTVLQKGIADLGTLVEITEIVTVHEDGKMDIRTRGLKVFSILELIKSIPEKLYSGAIVNYPDNNMKHDLAFIRKVIASIRELHKFLNISKDFKKKEEELFSYDIAHHAGLSVEEEYEFLGLLEEAQRLEYLKRHLNKVIPIVAGMESLKEKIKLNGHFRELKGFNFDT